MDARTHTKCSEQQQQKSAISMRLIQATKFGWLRNAKGELVVRERNKYTTSSVGTTHEWTDQMYTATKINGFPSLIPRMYAQFIDTLTHSHMESAKQLWQTHTTNYIDRQELYSTTPQSNNIRLYFKCVCQNSSPWYPILLFGAVICSAEC